MGETTWTTRDNSCKVRRLNGRRTGNGWESGWGLGARASRPRGSWKTIRGRKSTVFHNLPSSGAAESRPPGCHAMVVQKVMRHFRGCGILPRPSGWRAEAQITGRPRPLPQPPGIRACSRFFSGGSRARGLSGKWWRQGRAWRFGGWREGPYRQGRDCRDSCGRWA